MEGFLRRFFSRVHWTLMSSSVCRCWPVIASTLLIAKSIGLSHRGRRDESVSWRSVRTHTFPYPKFIANKHTLGSTLALPHVSKMGWRDGGKTHERKGWQRKRGSSSEGQIVALKFMAFFTLCAEKSIVFTMNERSAGQQSWGQKDGGEREWELGGGWLHYWRQRQERSRLKTQPSG